MQERKSTLKSCSQAVSPASRSTNQPPQAQQTRRCQEKTASVTAMPDSPNSPQGQDMLIWARARGEMRGRQTAGGRPEIENKPSNSPQKRRSYQLRHNPRPKVQLWARVLGSQGPRVCHCTIIDLLQLAVYHLLLLQELWSKTNHHTKQVWQRAWSRKTKHRTQEV